MRTKALSVLFLTIFIDLLGFGIIIPILPIFSRELGASDIMVGFIAAAYSFAQFIATPVWGVLSDRFGRRPIILSSILVTAVASLIFAESTELWILFIARALSGVGSGNISAAQAYIADITPPQKRAQSMGLVGAAFGLGFIFGPAAGGYIKTYLGAPWLGYIPAILCVINVVLAYFFLPESLKQKTSKLGKIRVLPLADFATIFAQRGRRDLFGINFVYIIAFFMFQITAALLWADVYKFSEQKVSNVFSFLGVCTAVMQGGLIGIFSRKLGELRMLWIGTFLMAVVLAIMSFIPAGYFLPWGLVTIFVMSISQAMVSPASLSLMTRLSGKNEQGSVLGLFQSFSSLARGVGPIIGGALYHINIHVPYLFGAGILFANILFIRSLTGVLPTQLEAAQARDAQTE